MTTTKPGNPFKVGDDVRITHDRYHQGYTGRITKINGPKTVEIKLDAGFYLWRVKVANLEINQPIPAPGTDPREWPPGKTFGELTPAQRQAAIRSAAAKFQAELTANASALGKVLEDFEAGHRTGDVLTGDEIGDCQAMGANPPVVAAIILRDATTPEPTQAEHIQLSPEAVEKFALAADIADELERRDAEPVHVRTPGKAYDNAGRHTGPGQWLSVIHEANRIDPEMFGEPQCSQQAEGWTEIYPNAKVIHRSDESVSVISTTSYGRQVLAEAASRLGL